METEKRVKKVIHSINLTDGKKGGIRKKIQGKVTPETLEMFTKMAKDMGFKSRDEMSNTLLALYSKYFSPLPTDEPLNADTILLFDWMTDNMLRETWGIKKITNTYRDALKMLLLVLFLPFTEDRFENEFRKMMQKEFEKKESYYMQFSLGQFEEEIQKDVCEQMVKPLSILGDKKKKNKR